MISSDRRAISWRCHRGRRSDISAISPSWVVISPRPPAESRWASSTRLRCRSPWPNRWLGLSWHAAADSRSLGGYLLPLLPPSAGPLQPAPASSESIAHMQKGASVAPQCVSWKSRPGRPLDVIVDIQQTPAMAASLDVQAARSCDGSALALATASGRQMDVQNLPAQTAVAVAHGVRTTKQPRSPFRVCLAS